MRQRSLIEISGLVDVCYSTGRHIMHAFYIAQLFHINIQAYIQIWKGRSDVVVRSPTAISGDRNSNQKPRVLPGVSLGFFLRLQERLVQGRRRSHLVTFFSNSLLNLSYDSVQSQHLRNCRQVTQQVSFCYFPFC